MTIERYSVGLVRGASVSAGEAYAELLASAGSPVSIKSITVTTNTNIGGAVALSRAFAIGTGAATGIFTGISHRTIATQPTGPARAQIAWTSSGVTPTGFVSKLREEILPVATGQTRSLWDVSVDGPLVVEPGQSILLLNPGTGIDGGGLRINMTWEEGRL